MQIPWNLANILSLARLIATVPLSVLILWATHWSLFAAGLLFMAMAITDTLDGRLARRYAWVSNIGIFLVNAECRERSPEERRATRPG